MGDRVLPRLVADLRDAHGCHTLILYGSRARGDATPVSDYDLIGFREGRAATIHDARRIGGVWLDAFLCPDTTRPGTLMRVRGGRVLFQRDGFGDALLARLERFHARGPKRLTPSEIESRTAWARKMLERMARGDAEANYRRAWLLTALLEDYFAIRGLWFEGPKLALAWLRHNAPDTFRRFDRALRPRAEAATIEALVADVVPLTSAPPGTRGARR
ncbi:MAG: hypothetical protein AB7S41_18205 [Parvibaculaceae bacterium]